MENKNPLRFKTKKEFEKEFGQDWRTEIRFCWPDSMDYLFGTIVEKQCVRWICKEYIRYTNMWSIYSGMTTTRRLPKYLKDGTQIRVGMKLIWSITREFVIVNTLYGPYGDASQVGVKCCCTTCQRNVSNNVPKIIHRANISDLVRIAYLD